MDLEAFTNAGVPCVADQMSNLSVGPSAHDQEELEMDLEAFTERYGPDPNKQDLVILVPKQDDPTQQVRAFSSSSMHSSLHIRVKAPPQQGILITELGSVSLQAARRSSALCCSTPGAQCPSGGTV